MEQTNKEIIREFKDSIQYRADHKKLIDKFLKRVRKFFLDDGIHVRTPTFVNSFGVELDWSYYRQRLGSGIDIPRDFLNIQRLARFCEEFECEFEYTTCDGKRYIFTYKDIDMSHAFFGW